MADARGDRVEAQLGQLLLRSNRSYLYDAVVDGLDGVDATTYPVMSGLARIGPTTSTALAAAVGIDRSAVTRYLSRLEAIGYVRRGPHGEDGRATSVELSAAGREQTDVMHRRLSEIFDGILSTWSAADAEQFVAGLERFTAALVQLRSS